MAPAQPSTPPGAPVPPKPAKPRRAPSAPEKRGASQPLPALRGVPAEPVHVKPDSDAAAGEDEMVVVLQDPEGFAPSSAVLSPAAYALASLFDGKRNAAEVARAFGENFGQGVEQDQVHGLAAELDKALFLASPRFEEQVRRTVKRYLDAKVRPAAHSGEAYPDDPEQIQKMIRDFFTSPEGPGAVPVSQFAKRHCIQGMVLPHIDLRVGGATYAHGYKALLEGCQADLFVILGVAHKGPAEALFNVSSKDFATPLGVVKTARRMAERLQKAAGVDRGLAEFSHKNEHSVEFQVLLLSALLGERAGRSFEILPILCGPSEPFIEAERNPVQDDHFRAFLEKLRAELDKSRRRWCLLSSVDLSHVGPKFGHSTAMTQRLLRPVERSDRKMLAKVESLDPDAFFFEILRTKNSHNVDAVISVLALLTLGRDVFKKGKLLHYGQMLEAPTKSAVTFASLAFE